MNGDNKIRPSWWYASIGIALILSGASLFVYFLIHGITHMTDSLTQVVVPGHAVLPLNTPATYTIFLEENSVMNGRIYSIKENIDGLSCTVTQQSENRQIPLQKPSMSTTYDLGGRSGHSVLEFTTKSAGQYEISCDYAQGSSGPQTVVAVGSGVGKSIMQTVGLGLLSMFGGLGSGVLIVVLVYRKRKEATKQLATEARWPR